MRNILYILLGSFLTFASIAYAATPVFTVPQGGTGSSSPSGILFGNNNSTPLSTLTVGTGLTLTGTTLAATGGSSASSTLLGDTNTWNGHDAFNNIITGSITGSAGSVANSVTFNSSGGAAANSTFNGSGALTVDYHTVGAQIAGNYDTFAYPFNATTNYGVNNSSTSTIQFFQSGFNASSTSHLDQIQVGSTTANNNGGMATSTFFGNVDVKGYIEDDTITNSLVFDGTGGALTAYGGSNCTSGQAPTGINGAGTVQNCTAYTQNGVTSVTATTPILSSGGATPALTWVGLATTSQPNSSNLLTSNGGAGVYGTATSTLTASGPLTGSFTQVGSGGSLGCTTASNGVAGCLNSSDWATFNGKQATLSATWPEILTGATLSFGWATTSQPASSNIFVSNGSNGFYGVATGTVSAGSSAITVTAGRAAIGGALAIDCATAGSGQNGCLSSTDWSTFNGKDSFAWPFTPTNNYGINTNATSTRLSFLGGFYASSTASAPNIEQNLSVGGDGTLQFGAPFEIASTSTSSLQMVIRNSNIANAATSSADLILENASSTYSNYYGDLGMNSAVNADINFTGFAAQDTYLYSSDANLDFAAASTTGAFGINFFTGGAKTAQKRLSISSAGVVTINNITSALVLSTSGALSAYSPPANCSNQASQGLSATGASFNCASINNAWWSGAQLTVGNGGTGQTSFTASQLLYGNGTNALSSVATSSPTFNGGLTTSGTAGSWVGGSGFTVSLANANGNSVLGCSGSASCTPTSVATSSLFTFSPAFSTTGTIQNVTYQSFTYATSTAWTGTTTIGLEVGYAETWNSVRCFTDAGTLDVDLYHASSHLNYDRQASTTIGVFNLSTNNTITAGDATKVDIGTAASSPTKITCTIKKSL